MPIGCRVRMRRILRCALPSAPELTCLPCLELRVIRNLLAFLREMPDEVAGVLWATQLGSLCIEVLAAWRSWRSAVRAAT